MSNKALEKALIDIEDAAICLENHGAMGHAEDLRTAVALLVAERDALRATHKEAMPLILDIRARAAALLTERDALAAELARYKRGGAP